MKDHLHSQNDQNASSDQFNRNALHEVVANEGGVANQGNISEVVAKRNKKIIVFFVGGVTAGEIRMMDSLREEYRNREITIVLGSTHLLTPDKYLDQLNKMAPFI